MGYLVLVNSFPLVKAGGGYSEDMVYLAIWGLEEGGFVCKGGAWGGPIAVFQSLYCKSCGCLFLVVDGVELLDLAQGGGTDGVLS